MSPLSQLLSLKLAVTPSLPLSFLSKSSLYHTHSFCGTHQTSSHNEVALHHHKHCCESKWAGEEEASVCALFPNYLLQTERVWGQNVERRADEWKIMKATVNGWTTEMTICASETMCKKDSLQTVATLAQSVWLCCFSALKMPGSVLGRWMTHTRSSKLTSGFSTLTHKYNDAQYASAYYQTRCVCG